MRKLKIGTYSSKTKHLQINKKFAVSRERKDRGVGNLPPAHNTKRSPLKKLLLILILVGIIAGIGFGYLRFQEVSSRVERYTESGEKIECKNNSYS